MLKFILQREPTRKHRAGAGLKRHWAIMIWALAALGAYSVSGEVLSNSVYRLEVEKQAGRLALALQDQKMGIVVADGVIHSAQRTTGDGAMLFRGLREVSVAAKEDTLTIRGKLAGLDVEQQFSLPANKSYMEERITLANCSSEIIRLEEFEVGLRKHIASTVGRVPADLKEDRVVALPFRKRPTDIDGELHDYSFKQLFTQPGGAQRVNMDEKWQKARGFSGYVPSRHRSSEGWAWTHRDASLCVFKFSQELLEFSVISTLVDPEGIVLRFGGSSMVDGMPSCLLEIQPGRSISLGLNRYQTVSGNYVQGLYSLRAFLDERGCRFPANYNPPVHWNELYDNPFWTVDTPGTPLGRRDDTRAALYTESMLEAEAAKARDYGCEALYLDPGWDSSFGTLIWGEQWLGRRNDFMRHIKNDYGLRVSLHCALASWMSHPLCRTNHSAVASYPSSSFRKDAEGRTMIDSICTGSRQYQDVALNRMVESCADGVGFLMFDGDWYQGGCWNREHGHPVPYQKEDQVEAIAGLARRLHAMYPGVLIEMHDPIGGGSPAQFTPVYYKHGLPGSFDENWGYELMWRPMHDLRTGVAKALYYYNMGCNVPAYLHVDLREDNEHAVVLWWYASTCRHLGIGGTHANPIIADLQKREMKQYRQLDRFYKRGEFYGINEEIHLHVLPEENAFVVNVFNLANETRVIRGRFDLHQAKGLDVNRYYTRSGNWGEFEKGGILMVKLEMAPWSAQVGEFRAVTALKEKR